MKLLSVSARLLSRPSFVLRLMSVLMLASPALADVYELRCDRSAADRNLRADIKKAMNINSFAEAEKKIDHLMNRLGRGSHADGVLNPISLRTKFEAKGGGGVQGLATYLADRICLEVRYPHAGYESHVRAYFENHWRSAQMSPEDIGRRLTLLRDAVIAAKERGASEDEIQALSRKVNMFRAEIEDGLKAQILVPPIVTVNIGFREKLNEFWFNHFNIYSNKTSLNSAPYYRTLRKYQGSQFRDLLIASAKDPAMLVYLDLHTSIRDLKNPNGDGGLNENYAREVMELHTLGVGPLSGVYSQEDVTAAARILTGWGLTTENGRQVFSFKANLHDRQGANKKTVMGVAHYVPFNKDRPEAQINEGLGLLTQLARHPRTRANICRKLIRRFVGENLVEPLNGQKGVLHDCMNAWDENGDLRGVYASIVTSREMWDLRNYQKDVKNPLTIAVSYLRMVGVQAPNLLAPTVSESCKEAHNNRISCHPVVAAVHGITAALGMPTGQTAPPIGYSERGADYATASMAVEVLRFTYSNSELRNVLYNPFNSQRISTLAFEKLTLQKLDGKATEVRSNLSVLAAASLRIYPRDWLSRVGADAAIATLRREPYTDLDNRPRPFRTLATIIGGSRLFLYE